MGGSEGGSVGCSIGGSVGRSVGGSVGITAGLTDTPNSSTAANNEGEVVSYQSIYESTKPNESTAGYTNLHFEHAGLPNEAHDGPVPPRQNTSRSKPLQGATSVGQSGPSQQLQLSNASASGQELW